ncbi:MAG TPA: hypothetical protein VF695_15610 [Sphingomonas sp.]|jgi:hypothetical protein
MNAMIDTLKVAKAFEEAGFVKAQAETLSITIAEATSASREDLVTKEFLRAELALVRAEMAGLKNDLVRWMLGSQVMLVVVLVALSNFTRAFN